MSESLHHPADLPLSSLSQGDGKRGLPGSSLGLPCPEGAGRSVLQLDPLGEAAQGGPRDLPFHLHQVLLLHAVARVLEPVRELPVVGEEE
jgi:hypothetical protein